VFKVDGFVEKPDATTASLLLAGGDHYWNGGIFLFRPDAYLRALNEHAPAVLEAARRSLKDCGRTTIRIHPETAAFAASPSISIDYAVMEKSDSVAVVPVNMGWSDLGSWDALYEISTKDAAGNSGSGDIVTIDSHGCLIRSAGPVVVTVGVEDLIVIATKDAVLIVRRGDSQRVKEAYDLLASGSHKSLN
jgi:mannose-1-phosphate guanylyltransferase/mannose-1-phosphate guanylyltransferase/mannose-6-phosphate isomerase